MSQNGTVDPGFNAILIRSCIDLADLAQELGQAQIAADARRMAQDGIARAIRPVHSPLDGDTVYVLSTMKREFDPTPAAVTRLGGLAADAVARSIMRGVYEAEPLAGVPAYRDLTP